MTEFMKTAIQMHSDEELRQLDELINDMDRKSIVNKLRRMYASRGISKIMSVIQDGLRSVQLDESDSTYDEESSTKPFRMPNSFSTNGDPPPKTPPQPDKKNGPRRVALTLLEKAPTPPSTNQSKNSVSGTPWEERNERFHTMNGTNLISQLNEASDSKSNTDKSNGSQNPNKRNSGDDPVSEPDPKRPKV